MDSIEFKGFSIRGKNDREITAVSQQTTASSEEITSSMEEQAATTIELAQYTN
ncbi:hypothetical protein JFV29_21900 [Peribacillus sp. TH16]|uniref:hypothetical protein n=1 Tax=Peribacillus sp. TH16 TaxID=2798482 RepID=UPI001913B46A|nr:hypothetical protein [Peribacillus sp. TH16]MBK5484498.1 hypothetical protein [Peribacillus sp. TH16]